MHEPSEKYNGYTNYETWCVNLWLSNEPGTDSESRALVQSYAEDYDAAQALREYVETLTDLDEASLRSDLLTHALGRVNWQELTDHYREE